MRDCLGQKISQIFRQQVEVDTQRRCPAVVDLCLSRTAATQGEIDLSLRQLDSVAITGTLFSRTNRLYGKADDLFRSLSHCLSTNGCVVSVVVLCRGSNR